MTSLAVIGAGAFGRLMLTHLSDHFETAAFDPALDDGAIAALGARPLPTLAAAGDAGIVVVATPVQTMETVLADLAPHLKPGTLALDVGSVKVKPARLMDALLPDGVEIVCTHPLFGPQSARDGLTGLKIAVCPVRGERHGCVAAFLADTLGLSVIETTPDRHDRELAYVQGLTHLLAKTLLEMRLEPFQLTTVTYDLLRQAIGYVEGDSPELFRAIEMENPFAAEARQAFFDAVRRTEAGLAPSGPEPAPAPETGPRAAR